MLICDMFNALPVVPEFNGKPSMVAIAGYTPDDLRIKELLLAGERLEAFKYGYVQQVSDYDFAEGEEVPDDYDSYDDYMDELEAQQLYNQSMQRVEASMVEREKLFSRRLREEDDAKNKVNAVDEVSTKEAVS